MLILLMVTIIFSVSLRAQKPGQDSWDNLNRLQAGQKIEVVQMDMKSLKGRFLGFTDEMISLRVKKDEVAVHREEVVRVSLRQKPKRLRNILIGAGVGAGAVMGIGLGVVAAMGGSDDPGVVMNPAMALGAGLGGALGAATPSYETIYRVKRKKPAKVLYRTITPKPASKETSAPEKKEEER